MPFRVLAFFHPFFRLLLPTPLGPEPPDCPGPLAAAPVAPPSTALDAPPSPQGVSWRLFKAPLVSHLLHGPLPSR